MPGKIIPEALRQLFKKEATHTYPKEAFLTPKDFRGKLIYHPERCIGCNLCIRACPAEALELVKLGDKKYDFAIYHDRCVNCGQCVEVCPTDTLEMIADHEMGAYSRADLKWKYKPTL